MKNVEEEEFSSAPSQDVIVFSPTFTTYKEDKGVLHHVREDATMDSGKKVHIRVCVSVCVCVLVFNHLLKALRLAE